MPWPTRAHRIAAAVLLGSGVLSVEQGARADAGAPTKQEGIAEAKKYFEAGLKFYKDGRYAEALAAFLEANRRTPRESVQRNIAQTKRDLQDFAGAFKAYEELLARWGASMKPVDRANVERARDELAALTGVINVTIADAAAIVLLDGKPVGPPPLGLRLNPGSHVVVVTKPGFDPLERKAEILGRDAIVIAGPLVESLVTGHVGIEVASSDEPATVFIDGADVGRAPWQGDLAPGVHRIEAKSAAGSATTTIEVSRGGDHRAVLTIAAKPAGVPAPPVAPATDPWTGLYGGFNLRGAFATTQHNNVADGAAYGTSAESRGLYGGGIGARAGYGFGLVGVEGSFLALYDYAGVRVTDANAVAPNGALGRRDDWSFHRVGGSLTVGARVRPKTMPLRPSFGLSFGVSGKAIDYSRKVEGASSRDAADFVFYLAPTLALDGGVEIGNTPGGRLYVGALVLADFPGSHTLSTRTSTGGRFPIPPSSTVHVTTGTDVFLGPVVGIVLGH